MSGKPPLPTGQSSLVKSRICLRASAEPGNGHRPDDRTCTICPEPDPPPLRSFSSPSTEKAATLLVASSHHVKHDTDCCFAGHSRGTTSILVAIPPLILLFILGLLVTGYTMPLARQPWMRSRHHGAAPPPATDRSASANTSASLSALWHSMSDAELFARALALSVSPPLSSEPSSKTRCRGEGRWVSRLEKGGGGRWGKARTRREWVLDAKTRGSGSTRVQGCPWRIAFLFLTTRGQMPSQAAWERYFHGYDDYFRVYVHSPPGHQLGPEAGVLHGRQVPSRRGPTVDAQRRLIGNALLDPTNAWFILCESCIPIQDFEHTYGNLMASNRSFLISMTMFDEMKMRTEEKKKGSITSGRDCQWFAVARVYAERVVAAGVAAGLELGLRKNETGGKRRAPVNLVTALCALEPGGASSGMFGDAGRLGNLSPGSKIVRGKQPMVDGQIQKQRFGEDR